MIHNCTDGYRCENTFGSFKCVRERHCGTGYTVQHETQSCVDIDECENGLHNCGRGLVCHNVPGTFKCVQPQCPPDQRFDLRSGSCARIRCPAGFELRLNSLGGIARCHDVDECKQSPCGRDQTCLNTLGSFRCEGPATGQCGEGYVFRDGKCRDLDECADQSICPADARCLNLEGSFECQCIEPGFEFVAGKCVDVDECELGRPCPAGAQCRNLKGSFECSCARGFAWNSTSRDCEDVDECSSAACDHQCVNLRGSYFCLCRPGFELMADGKSCRKIKNRCPVGYEPERGSCRDIDECNDGRPRCQRPNELCVNLRGGFRCEKIVCPPGGYSLIEPNHCHSDNPRLPNMPNSHFYSFVAIPSKLGPLPATIFIVRFNPKSTMPSFNLRMNNPGKAAAAAFNLIIKSDRPRQAELVLSRTIEGPQKIQMDISTEFNDEFDEILGDCRPTWTRVHSIVHLTVYVSEHEF